jgi:predicted CopG family antitoxin
MPTDKTIKISEQCHEQLSDYKEAHGHKSFDSAIRELVGDAV